MMSGTQFRQGDVILVPVPFTDLKGSKQRPALVLSNESYNDESAYDDIIICAITSKMKEEPYSLVLEQTDMDEGKIYFVSRIRVDKIFTIDKAIIKRKLGRVSSPCLDRVKHELMTLFLR